MPGTDTPGGAGPVSGDARARAASPTGPNWLAVASTMSWVWAVLTVLGVIAVVVPLVVSNDPQAPRIGPGIIISGGLGVVTGIGAYGVRKAKRPYNFVAVFACIAWVVDLLGSSMRIGLMGILVNLSILAIVLLQWRRFA